MNNLLLQLMIILKETTQSLLVGGCVCDASLSKEAKDFDIVIPDSDCWEGLSESLSLNGWNVKEAGLRFNVLHVSKNGINFEIAAFRNDGEYIDCKPVDVTLGDLNTDAYRRDFTVNALYYDSFEDKNLDPTGKGLYDIETKTLRFVGKAKDRLNEDPMRIFRFYRFIQKGFNPNPKCLRAVRTFFPEALKLLSENGAEGMREEIEKICLR